MVPTDDPRGRKIATSQGPQRRAKRLPSEVDMPASIEAIISAVDEELGRHPIPDWAGIRPGVENLFGKAEAALARRRPTATASQEERMVIGVFGRALPEIRATADDFFRFAQDARSGDSDTQVGLFARWMRASPRAGLVFRLVEFYRVICRASVERARHAASGEVLELAADIRGLLNAIAKVRSRWLEPNLRDSAGGLQFLQRVRDEFHVLMQSLTGATEDDVRSVDTEYPFPPYTGPLNERLEYARRLLPGPFASIVSCCSAIIDGLAADFPEHPISVNNRPSTSYRDRRILAFWDVGVPIDEIIAYEGMGAHADPEAAVRAAVARARKAARVTREDREGLQEESADQGEACATSNSGSTKPGVT